MTNIGLNKTHFKQNKNNLKMISLGNLKHELKDKQLTWMCFKM